MIDAEMATRPQVTPREPLRRDRERGLIAGVCAGVARHVGIDPLIVRVAFVAAATAGGAASRCTCSAGRSCPTTTRRATRPCCGAAAAGSRRRSASGC